MDASDVGKYADVMEEIKRRIEVVNLFMPRPRGALFVAATVETVGLQFRKIFELIAFASLAANRGQYSFVYSDFAKHWEASRLLRNLRRINPEFYPQPVIEIATDHPGALHALQYRQHDYLTQQELISFHGRCGTLMHGANPFGQPIDYAQFQQSFPEWRVKIMNLLNNHQIRLPGDRGLYLFHMKEEGHEKVRWYRFDPPE